MLKQIILFFCLLEIGGCVWAAESGQAIVYKIDIKDEIGPGIWRLVDKSFNEAGKAKADYILIHMNTYGGMVVFADSLRSRILNYNKPVWVFIDNNAASAGALISIACNKIYMREGANIGAATVVNQSGQAMPDKYQSYMRSMIRATAQAHGKDTLIQEQDTIIRWKRDPHIAEAMVDPNVRIEGISDSGKIVTFTPHEAIKYGFCDGIAENVEEVLRQEKIENYVLESYSPTVTDRIIGFLINPIMQGLFIMVIVGGIYFELQTPGVGFPLLAALTACLLYFAPLYLEGFASNWEIIAFIVRSLFLVVCCSLLALGGSVWIGAKVLTSRRWAFALHAEHKVADGYVGVDMSIQNVVGKSGLTVTDLRPAGKVSVGEEVYDAVSLLGEYISKDTEVNIKKYQAGQVYVVKK